MIERSFKEILDTTGLSLSQIGELVKKDKSTLSRLASGNYPNLEERRKEVIDALLVAGAIKETDVNVEESLGREYRVNPEVFIRTQNVVRFDDLADGLLEPDSTLNSSIGIVLGPPGMEKPSQPDITLPSPRLRICTVYGRVHAHIPHAPDRRYTDRRFI